MKSAYELAMERFADDTPARSLTDAQKAELAELDQRYQAKIAEREIFLQGQLTKARAESDATAIEQLETQLRHEKARLEDEKEAAKDKVRAG